jgi:Mg-chelatase subunit ChlD
MKKVFRTLTIFVVAFSFFTGKVTAQTNPGEVKFTKTAKVVAGEKEDGRSALINLNIDGNSFNMYSSEKKVVLVLDDSGSMSENNKLSELKSSANKLAEELLKPSNKQKIKVGVVYYTNEISKKCELSTDLNQVKDC